MCVRLRLINILSLEGQIWTWQIFSYLKRTISLGDFIEKNYKALQVFRTEEKLSYLLPAFKNIAHLLLIAS